MWAFLAKLVQGFVSRCAAKLFVLFAVSVCPSFASGHHHDLDGLHVFLKKSPTGFNDTLVRIRGGHRSASNSLSSFVCSSFLRNKCNDHDSQEFVSLLGLHSD